MFEFLNQADCTG